MESKPFLFGRFQFEDQFRAALIKQGTKLIHIVFLDDTHVRCIFAPINELRYFEEMYNTNDAPRKVKSVARRFLKKSPLTGLKREMTKKARGVLKEIIDL